MNAKNEFECSPKECAAAGDRYWRGTITERAVRTGGNRGITRFHTVFRCSAACISPKLRRSLGAKEQACFQCATLASRCTSYPASRAARAMGSFLGRASWHRKQQRAEQTCFARARWHTAQSRPLGTRSCERPEIARALPRPRQSDQRGDGLRPSATRRVCA